MVVLSFLIQLLRSPKSIQNLALEFETTCLRAILTPNSTRLAGKKSAPPVSFLTRTGHCTGNDLLSQDLSSNYHRRCSVSLPGSGWDRVVPLRSGHQRTTPVFRCWVSGDSQRSCYFLAALFACLPNQLTPALWHPYGDLLFFQSVQTAFPFTAVPGTKYRRTRMLRLPSSSLDLQRNFILGFLTPVIGIKTIG